MGWTERVDCGASKEGVFECVISLHLLGIKNVLKKGSQYRLALRGVKDIKTTLGGKGKYESMKYLVFLNKICPKLMKLGFNDSLALSPKS